MKVEVHVAALLRARCGGSGNMTVEGSSIREVVEAIDREYPGFTDSMLQPDGSIQKGVLLSINGELVRPHAAAGTAVQAGDKINFLSAFSGG